MGQAKQRGTFEERKAAAIVTENREGNVGKAGPDGGVVESYAAGRSGH